MFLHYNMKKTVQSWSQGKVLKMYQKILNGILLSAMANVHFNSAFVTSSLLLNISCKLWLVFFPFLQSICLPLPTNCHTHGGYRKFTDTPLASCFKDVWSSTTAVLIFVTIGISVFFLWWRIVFAFIFPHCEFIKL